MPRKGALGELVPFSPFKLEENKTIPFGDDEVIVLMEPDEGVAFFGRVQMRVYRGSVLVFGHSFHEGPLFHPLYAPYTSLSLSLWSSSLSPSPSPSLPPPGADPVADAIRSFGKEKESRKRVILVLKPLEGSDLPKGWFEMPNSVADHFRPSDPFVIPGFHPLLEVPSECVVPQFVEPPAHKQVMGCIPSANDIKKSHFSVLVCGPTHSGKSTYLLFLESDIGQSEFTAPGLVSLNILTVIKSKPLVGPTFTHIRSPVRSYYVGDTSPARKPEYYIKAFNALIDFYQSTFPGVPLVINTCGWVQGLGRELLEQQLQYAKPNVLVNMRSPIEYGKKAGIRRSDADFLTPEFMNELFGGKIPTYFDSQIAVYSGSNVLRKEKVSVEVRLAQMLSYFHAHAVPITSHIPYGVPWNKLRLVFSEEVAPSQALRALNGTVVGLCIDETPYSVYNPDDSEETAYLYPQFIVGDDTPLCECVGTGIVRSIDSATRTMYITVPRDVDPARLQRVNTLLRGSIPTPMPMSLEYGDGSFKLSSAPYAAVDTSQLKLKKDASDSAQRAQEKNQNNKNKKNRNNNNNKFNNNNNNNNNNTTSPKGHNIGTQRRETETVDEYGPDTELDPTHSLKTNEGPKPISEIGLEEELELLEEHNNKHTNKQQQKRKAEVESPKHKKQKHEEDDGEGVSLQSALEEQEQALEDMEDDETLEHEPIQYQGNQTVRDGKTFRQMLTEKKRAEASKNVAKRIAPVGDNDIVGAKPAKRIPRKLKKKVAAK